jgi:hypothetical protein
MILNLDVFEEKIEEIQLKGKIYKIPSDIPTILYLQLVKTKDLPAGEGMEEGVKIIHKIFQIHQPDLSFDEFSGIITNNQYTAIINFLFAGLSVEETQQQLAEIRQSIKDGKKKPLPAEN